MEEFKKDYIQLCSQIAELAMSLKQINDKYTNNEAFWEDNKEQLTKLIEGEFKEIIEDALKIQKLLKIIYNEL